MIDGCGYSEVWTDFIYIFSSKMLSHIYMENDIIYLANGYSLCIHIIYIPFDILGAIYWLTHTSIDSVQNYPIIFK